VRKTPKKLNDLRVALQATLTNIAFMGACLHDTCHKLGALHPHDVHTAPGDVSGNIGDLQEDYERLGKLLDKVRIDANNYSEFFSK
jgi:hypothetical protein